MAKKQLKQPEQMTNRELEIVVRTGEDFFDKEYVDYCMYVIENRALPSIIDGLKPGARKIMHAAFHILSETKKSNFVDLVGTTMSYSKYHHGDASLLGTIKTLGTQYTDNLAPLKIIGSEGDLKSPESAAARYLFVRLSQYSKLLKQNSNILEYNYDGDTRVEPKYYLPIIPLVLTSRTTGLGVGFAYSLQCSYNPVSIVDKCLEVLKNGSMSGHLIPHIRQWTGSFIQTGNKIYAKGRYEIHKNKIHVYEFAPNVTYEDFEDNVAKLIETGKCLKYDNHSTDEVHYELTMSSEFMSKYADVPEKLEKHLKLGEVLKKPTLNMLDENGKLIEFGSVEEVLEYFVEFRESKYETLKEVIIKDLEQQLAQSEQMQKFIDLYLSGNIQFGKDIPFSKTIEQIESHNLSEELADTKLSKLTKEEYDKLTQKIQQLIKQIEHTKNTTAKEMYIEDLQNLRKDLEQEYGQFAEYTYIDKI